MNTTLPDTADYPYWISMMQDPEADFHATQQAFGKYWEHRTHGKGDGWKVFKRWEYINRSRVGPDGKLPAPGYVRDQFERYRQDHLTESASGNWSLVGPTALPANATGQPNGMGRINAIGFHPSNANTIYIGSPSGGFWKTSDAGASWSSLSADLPTLGVSAILVHPLAPNTIWIGTGDRDAGDAPGIGVYKSTDGGVSWSVSSTGMGDRTVGMLLMHPSDADILMAATNGGIYKSTDGGTTWALKSSNTGNYRDIKFKPGDPAIVYATEDGRFYRSNDTGESWTEITAGIIAGSRMVIGVSANGPSTVYLCQTNGPFAGLLRSTDSGLTFATQSTSPNIMDYECDGSGPNSQAWYDLCITVDPANVNTLYVGGINIWKSVNGGVSWTINSHWVGSDWGVTCAPSVHADIHCLDWSPANGNLFTGCDGGIYVTSNGGSTWNDISSGIAIAQVYKIGQSATNESLVLNGYQDNGSACNLGAGFTTVLGGDGMECIIDYTDENFRYASVYFGEILRSTGSWYYTIAGNGVNGITESGGWVTPYILHETNPNTMFAGYKNVWRCTNIKAATPSWEPISTGETIECNVLENSPANPGILYVARGGSLQRSDNANDVSPSWVACTLPGGMTPTDLEAHPAEANTVYATAGYSVFKSTDGGMTWTNIRGSLPYINNNSIVYDVNSDEGLYLSNETSVFYRDATFSDWILFSDGLPPANVRELEIYYGSSYATSRLKAATYGLGLWSGDLLEMGVINPSNFTAVPVSTSQIDLGWTKNASNNEVVLVFNTVNAFGTPVNGTSYNTGNTLPGGGTVVYTGAANGFSHTGLGLNTPCYYKIWSVDGATQYSVGNIANATTFCTLVNAYPWTEGFENGGASPDCWTQKFESGTLSWAFQTGGYTGWTGPASAHTGTYNACLFINNYSYPVTRLISPPMDLTGIEIPVLRFWHTQEYWVPDQDELKIYYRTSPTGVWTLLATYSDNITDWTCESLLLPSASATYYVAFEGHANYAFGVCVDDVAVTDNLVTWDGTGDWSTPDNWTPAYYPASFDRVVINSGSCTLSSDVNCREIGIQPAANVTVSPGVTVMVDGEVVIFN